MFDDKTIDVAVTGAAGSIAYSLLFRLASGEVFGEHTDVRLNLIEIPDAMDALRGVAMEIRDCAYERLVDMQLTDDPADGFEGADYCILLGGMPRKEGMKRNDLVEANGPIYREQGQAINDYASEDVRVLTVANPCNTNCYVAKENAPEVPDERFMAMSRLDLNRTRFQLADRAGVSTADVKKIGIFGNHSETMFPDVFHATIKGKNAPDALDEDWLKTDLIETIQGRGTAIIEARGQSSAASAANAIVDHTKDLVQGTNWTSMAVPSDGSYDVEPGLVFSYPVTVDQSGWSVIKGLKHSEFAREKLRATEQELKEEREAVTDYLP